MKILLIKACGNPEHILFDRIIDLFGLWSSSTLEQLTSLTPKKHRIDLIKTTGDKKLNKINYKEYDLVGISYYTATAPLAYKIADNIRKKGVPVILGGFHATALPKEAKKHADSVVIGEAEITWPKLIKDYEKKQKIKDFYKQNTPIQAEKIPCNLGKTKSLITSYGIEASRGCINHCDFCAISNSPMGSKIRLKPVKKVLQTIKKEVPNYFLFLDASLNLNRKYSIELFKGMKKMNKKFACFFNANIADDKELLKLASDAGCIVCSIGFETTKQSNIKSLHKNTNQVKKYKNVVKKLHDHGIAVIASMAFGFDNDKPDVFIKTQEKLKEWNVDSVGANILTPLPGTPLFKRLEQEKRILTKDWSKYDYYNVVFQPKNMTPEELYNGTKKIVKNFFKIRNILPRAMSTTSLGYYQFMGLIQHQLSSKFVYNRLFT